MVEKKAHASRQKLLTLQKSILEDLKAEVRTYLEGLSPSLKKYYHEYKKEFKFFERTSSKKEILEEVSQSHIVFAGDYHTLNQSQRAVLRILREIVETKKDIILGVEFFLISHQAYIDQFLRDEISEKELLEKTDFINSWGFDWNNFKPLIDFAKAHGLKVVALNTYRVQGKLETDTYETLEERDTKASEIIAELTVENPLSLIYVIFGDLHIASTHMPKKVENILRSKSLKRKTTIIYQNSETVYWALAREGLEHEVEIVKLRDGVYCIENCTPWIKLQSYLNWQERTDALTPQLSSVWASFEPEDNIIDYNDQALSYLNIVCEFLDLPVEQLDQFSVHTLEDIDFYKALSGKLTKAEIQWVKKQLKARRSFVVPRENIIYLSDLSVNKASEEVTKYLYSLISGYRHIVLPDEHFFYSQIYLCTLGFLGSKIVNHKRKSEKEIDLIEYIGKCKYNIDECKIEDRDNEYVKRKIGVAEKVLYVKECEKRFLQGEKYSLDIKKLFDQSELLYEVAEILGHMLGDRLYRGMIKGQFSLREVRKLFVQDLLSVESAKENYLDLVQKLSSIELVYKSRKEQI